MKKQVLFIQGGGEDGYEADTALMRALQNSLGEGYEMNYPMIQTDESAPDFGWLQQIGEKISEAQGEVILIGHSFGASMLLKYLSENSIHKEIAGIFLLATPFWDGDETWKQPLKLQQDFEDKLPKIPIFFYHCKDDEEIPLDHFNRYKQKITRAIFHEIETGGHQLNNDLDLVAEDIQSL